jgi:hypothetical protein
VKADTIIQVHEDEGYRTALVTSIGPKFISLIWADSAGIKIRKILTNEIRARELDYPTKKAKVAFRKMGRDFGITKSAKRALRG